MSWSFWIYSISSSPFFFTSSLLSLSFSLFYSIPLSIKRITIRDDSQNLISVISYNSLLHIIGYVKIMHICKSVLKYYNLIFYSRFPSRPLDLLLENWFHFLFHFLFCSWSIIRIAFYVDNMRQCVFGKEKGREGKGTRTGRDTKSDLMLVEKWSLEIRKHFQKFSKISILHSSITEISIDIINVN